jgi:hypothetical protein
VEESVDLARHATERTKAIVHILYVCLSVDKFGLVNRIYNKSMEDR